MLLPSRIFKVAEENKLIARISKDTERAFDMQMITLIFNSVERQHIRNLASRILIGLKVNFEKKHGHIYRSRHGRLFSWSTCKTSRFCGVFLDLLIKLLRKTPFITKVPESWIGDSWKRK